MKKVFSLALLALTVLFSIPAHADEPLKIGVKAGLNVSDFHFSSEVFDKSNQTGWFIGPTVKFTLPIVGLGMDASVLYDYRSAKLNYATVEQTVKQQQLSIPVNLRYSIGLGGTANIFFFGGPQIAFNVGDKDYQWNKSSNYALKNSNFSVNLGFGVTALRHLQVSANYNIACGNTADVTWKTATDAATSIFHKKSSRNSSWQLGIAYFF
ncbi:MAG: porin family protein [Prevotella fusca]|uniref:porin family protein n=1 Tax=Prevotella fusca TaxID=589436 RepID=UPI003FA08B9F